MFPKWTFIRTFGGIKYFNISYVVLVAVPLLHELYVRTDSLASWLGWSAVLSPELKWAFVASLLFALAIAGYQLCCPAEIKRFANSDEYVDAQFEQLFRSHPHHRLNTVLAQLEPSVDKDAIDRLSSLRNRVRSTEGKEKFKAQDELDKFVLHLLPDATQRFLESDYQTKNKKWPIARGLTFALFLAGSIVVLVLLALKSYAVLAGYGGSNMLIVTSRDIGLNLDAYTYDYREFASLERVLRRADIESTYSTLEPDRDEREGRRYLVPESTISQFQVVLNGAFDERGQFSLKAGPGQTYACRQLARAGRGSGCEEIVAPDNDIATTQCALIANQKRWWGGVAQPGRCSGGGGMFGWLRQRN